MPTVDDYIAAAMSAFRARRGDKAIHAGGRMIHTRTPGERILHLPNGDHVRVSVDDSGIATQVEADDALHAIVRPHTIEYRLTMRPAGPSISNRVRPVPIRTATIPRSSR